MNRMGDTREDGKLFWSYTTNVRKDGARGEWWVSPDKFSEKLLRKQNQQKAWKKENREAVNYKARNWARQNPEKTSTSTKRWRAANAENVRVKRLEWKRRNAGKNRASAKIYRKKNLSLVREKDRALSAKKRAARQDALVPLSKEQEKVISSVYLARSRISACLNLPFHVDHIIPISRGGKHTPSNLQILPAAVNLQKSNRV